MILVCPSFSNILSLFLSVCLLPLTSLWLCCNYVLGCNYVTNASKVHTFFSFITKEEGTLFFKFPIWSILNKDYWHFLGTWPCQKKCVVRLPALLHVPENMFNHFPKRKRDFLAEWGKSTSQMKKKKWYIFFCHARFYLYFLCLKKGLLGNSAGKASICSAEDPTDWEDPQEKR